MHGTDTPGLRPDRAQSSPRTFVVLLAIIAVVRICSNGLYPLLDKSEARYAYIGELMVQTGNWITPFIEHGVPFWAKPVLSTWFTAISLAALGINAFAARFSSLLIFYACAWMVYRLGTDERGREFGLAAACVFASTALAFYLGGAVMTDPALMLGVTLTMAAYWKSVANPTTHQRLWGYLFFIGVAIGVLAKGPIGAIIPGMSIVAWATQHRRWGDTWRRLPWIPGLLLCIVLVIPWYAAAEHRTPGFLRYFIIGEHFERFLVSHWEGDLYGSGRAHPIGSIWLFAVIAALPWSAIMLALLFRADARRALFRKSVFSDPWISYMIHWMLAPLVLFTFAKNILVTYAATALPAFALSTAQAIWPSESRADRAGIIVSAMIAPALMLGMLCAYFLDPASRLLPSQAGIVAAYKTLAAGRPSNLVYVFDKPYSADFYSGGKATVATTEAEIKRIMQSGDTYVAVDDHMMSKLPADLRGKLKAVAHANGTTLLHGQ